MSNPVTIQHDERTVTKLFGITERPDHVNYPIKGMHWDTVEHPDYRLSVQQTDFLGNHIQLIEMEAQNGTAINFTVDVPTVFVAIMIEGFVKFHRQGALVSYAMAGVLYMTYNPKTDFRLEASPGKHTMMVLSMGREWVMAAKTPFPKLSLLVDCLREERGETVVLPMCRLAQPMADLWESMRIVRSDLFTHRAELALNAAKLMSFYHGQLESGSCIKGQLSADTANAIFSYIQRNFRSDAEISIERIAEHVDVSPWKLREYAIFLYGKSIHKYVRDLRMETAARLLKATALPVSEIAVRVGYTNLPNFFTIFHRYFELTPQAYRKQNPKNG